jgi:hypothetical protein
MRRGRATKDTALQMTIGAGKVKRKSVSDKRDRAGKRIKLGKRGDGGIGSVGVSSEKT